MTTKLDPRALSHDDLVLNHFSLARAHPIEDRVALAGAAGFVGIGLFVGHYAALEADGFAPGGLRELLDEHGVCLAEIEVVPGLGADGSGGEGAAAVEAIAWRMADEFGCRYLQAIGPAGFADGVTIADAGRAYAGLCDRAGDHGLVVGLEALPFTDLVSVADVRRVVEAADRRNGGFCVDIWHHERGARDLASIADLAGELVTGVQMSDGTISPANPDYLTDCLENRVAPGSGEFDVAGFIAAIDATGTKVPWALETCSAWGWANPAEHVQRLADGMRAALSAR